MGEDGLMCAAAVRAVRAVYVRMLVMRMVLPPEWRVVDGCEGGCDPGRSCDGDEEEDEGKKRKGKEQKVLSGTYAKV